MGRVFRRSTAVPSECAPDTYEVAFLAGGAPRVADAALIALAERGLLRLSGPRVRAVDGAPPPHPVERALFLSCLRNRSIVSVHTALRRSPEVEEIGHRLAGRGLTTRFRRRPTRLGRACLRRAAESGGLPPYVLGGAAVLPDGPVRRRVLGAHPIPQGLGRSLTRMGRALDGDSERDSDHDSASDGGFGCGGGSGGGD
ncbi:TIGR04222 domain-containing membrane protein [Streptomyces sp. NPDC058867]|uniref:TIGR04222 domain-containing membrane protein n=1 Tax=unclassified Streptomyces TaxID=2593676 RepID=UPI0036BD25CA